MIVLDENKYHVFYENDTKQIVKHSSYLKTIIPDFKSFLADLLIKIYEEQHGINVEFKYVRKLSLIEEIRVIKYLRKYIKYLTNESIKFSIKLRYKNYVGESYCYGIYLI